MDQKRTAVRAFAEEIMEHIKEYLPPEYADMECKLEECGKLNGVKRTGICFKMPDQKISPVIYMERFCEDAGNGKSLEEIGQEIAETVMEDLGMGRTVMADIPVTDFDAVKEHLSIRLVNTKANREMLSAMPHRKMEDLSVICTLDFEEGVDPERMGSIRVTDRLMEQWGITGEELYHEAMQSISENRIPVLKSMEDVMEEMFTGTGSRNILLEQTPSLPEAGTPLILTNREGIYGAAALLYPGVMEKISGMFPQGFYILPSSTHEVLLMPKSGRTDAAELGSMVREVNREAVSREEFLSDRVYEYDREQKKIRQVPESIKKEREAER